MGAPRIKQKPFTISITRFPAHIVRESNLATFGSGEFRKALTEEISTHLLTEKIIQHVSSALISAEEKSKLIEFLRKKLQTHGTKEVLDAFGGKCPTHVRGSRTEVGKIEFFFAPKYKDEKIRVGVFSFAQPLKYD